MDGHGPRLTLLNGFSVTCAGIELELPLTAQRVLAFLALHDAPVQRSFVAGSLWLDSPADRAHASLRSALWRLRSCGLPLVRAHGQQLALGRDIAVDIRAAEQIARSTLAGEPDLPVVASSMFSADLLPDWYDDWIVLERESYRQLRLRALDTLCERLTNIGRFDDALDAGLSSIACEPLRESAHRAVIRLHLAEGNVCEAIRQYRLCRWLLRERLDIAPSERMEALLRRSGADPLDWPLGEAPQAGASVR